MGTTSTPAKTPYPDLEAIREASIALLEYLTRTVKEFRFKLQREQSRLAPGVGEMRLAVEELTPLIDDLGRKMESVRSELAVASGQGESVVDDLLTIAKRVRSKLTELLQATIPLQPNQVHNWFAGVHHSIDQSGFTRRINSEVSQAVALRTAKNPRQTRIRCDPSDRSVSLDGKPIETALNEEVYAYVGVLVDNYPNPISFDRIGQQASVLEGVNQTRFRNKLPRQIRSLVHVDGSGHVLKLPAPA